jgi:hypothetical protein
MESEDASMSEMTKTVHRAFQRRRLYSDVADGGACGRSAGSTSHQRKRQQWRIDTLRAGAGFGNNRRPGRSLYTGAVSFNGNNSVLDARSFSLTGQNSPRPSYKPSSKHHHRCGPFQIPSLFRNGSFSVVYSRIQNRNASLQTLQMPTPAERSGDFRRVPGPSSIL